MKNEIILGLVAPLGTDKTAFLEALEDDLKNIGIFSKKINLTECLIKINPSRGNINIQKSFDYFIKMEICSTLRLKRSRAELVKTIIDQIQSYRKKCNDKNIVYIVDQIKNESESELLNFIYRENYFQVSLFSNESKRDKCIKDKILHHSIFDKDRYKEFISEWIIGDKKIKDIFPNEIDEWIDTYENDIRNDTTHKLIYKDFVEINEELKRKKSGQQISEIFHKSQYFFNVDKMKDEIKEEVSRFLKILTGKYKEYPRQDEFGMSLAYQSGLRSNFSDNNRKIGASIFSEHGELIAHGSIRAPSKSPNTTLHDLSKVEAGYIKYKNKLEKWSEFLDEIKEGYSFESMLNLPNNDKNQAESGKIYVSHDSYVVLDSKGLPQEGSLSNNVSNLTERLNNLNDKALKREILEVISKAGHIPKERGNHNKSSIEELKKFINNTLDFHPFTHAEIAAILDATKMGISVRESTLYSTTFPCHLCAKDIISAGVKRVVYLEAYPKSKNKELYPENIIFDETNLTSDEKINNDKIKFDFYCGVSPTYYNYAFSSENKSKDEDMPARYKKISCFSHAENEVKRKIVNVIDGEKLEIDDPLYNLISKGEEEKRNPVII